MAICISPRALDFELPRGIGLGEEDADIRAGLANEALLDLAGGEQFALAAGERGIVDANLHRDRGRIDIDES